MTAVDRRRMLGASTSVVLASMAILILLAAAAWFLVIKPNRDAVKANAPQVAQAPAAAESAQPPPANVSRMSTTQLLSEARKALNEQRLLTPSGNNAFEFYLKVLEREPNNQVAQDALRETFPFGANEAEQAINQNNFSRAQREITLLAKADPNNYTLTILRSKLDAQQKLVDQQQQQAQNEAQRVAAAAAKKKQQEAAAAAAKSPDADQVASTTQGGDATKAADGPAQQPPAAQSVMSKPAPVSIQDAVLVHEVSPRYPTAAVRSRQEGWVELQYTVATDGEVQNVKVLDARPHHVFDRSAVNAVSRWKYKPALRNGLPMAVTMSRRIVFTLSATR